MSNKYLNIGLLLSIFLLLFLPFMSGCEHGGTPTPFPTNFKEDIVQINTTNKITKPLTGYDLLKISYNVLLDTFDNPFNILVIESYYTIFFSISFFLLIVFLSLDVCQIKVNCIYIIILHIFTFIFLIYELYELFNFEIYDIKIGTYLYLFVLFLLLFINFPIRKKSIHYAK